LNGVDVVIHNAAFELMQLEARGVELGEVHCTMQAARLTLGEGAMRLEHAVAAYLDLELMKDLQTSDWSAPSLTKAQLEYAALDAVMAWRVAQRIFPALGPQTPAYEIQVAATPAAARMKSRGFRLDLETHAELMAGLKTKRIEACAAYKSACAIIDSPAEIPTTPAQKRAALEAILSSDELKRWKRTPKSGELSTARNDLKRAARYPPILALVELSKIDKILTAFGPTLAALVSPVTGRIHANYLIAATASGRAACSRPNLQQAPRDKAFRALFKAVEGYVLVGADYASMELRAAAHISQRSADDRGVLERRGSAPPHRRRHCRQTARRGQRRRAPRGQGGQFRPRLRDGAQRADRRRMGRIRHRDRRSRGAPVARGVRAVIP
jgi:DNA polymerase-1